MALRLTITASANSAVTVQDVFPAEGTFCFTLDPSHSKTVDFTDAQYNHLKSKLDAMVAAGLLSYTVVDTEEARSDELLELKERTAMVVTLNNTTLTTPNLITLGIRKGDVCNVYVAATGITLSYTVDEVNAAAIFTATGTVVAWDKVGVGDMVYFTRDGELIASSDRTIPNPAGANHLIATVSQSPYQRSGYGRFFVKASDSRPYYMRDDGTEMSLGMTGSDPLIFKGTIAIPADFPTAAAVQNGWLYRVTAAVTDSDGTKTNTGMSFPAGSEIAWIGTWCELGDAPELRGKVINVNGNRTDAYTADGTLHSPYKTLAAAVAVAAAGDTIVAAPRTAGPYAENIVVPADVSLEGISGTYTYIDGNVTMGTGPCSLKYIAFTGITNNLTINGGTIMRDVVSYGQMTLPLATSKVQMWNCHVYSTACVAVTLGHASAEFYSVMGKLSTTGDNSVVSSIGKVILDLVEVSSNAGTQNTINAITSGYLRLFNTSVVNVGAAKAINASNGAGAAAPNVLSGVIASSGGANAIDVGAAVTQYNNVAALAGTITGAGIVKGVATDGAVMETDYTGAGVLLSASAPSTPSVVAAGTTGQVLRATTGAAPAFVSNYGLEHFDSRQGAPLDETLRVFRALSAGSLVRVGVDCRVAPTVASTETMTFDVQKNGATMLNAVVTLDAASVAGTLYPATLSVAAGAVDFVAGDIITVVRDYTIGTGGALLDTCVDLDIIRV